MRRKAQPKVGWNDEISDAPQRPVPSATPDQVQREIAEATKEATERVGMSGALGNVKAGGIRIDTAGGVNAYQGGDRKTSIEPDGDFFAGSNINIPAGTSFIVFAIAQDWNGEAMEEGDILIGDNSDDTSNIKWDASEGQWQFRLGTTIKVYMDTDGTIKAGGGDVTIDEFGVAFLNQEGNLTFEDTNGSLDNLVISSDADNFLVLKNAFGGKGISFHIDDAAHNVAQIDFDDTGIYLFDGNYDGAAGTQYLVDGSPHTHTGAEGGVAAETNAANIFGVTSPGGPSLFVATINGAPSGTSVVYNAPSSGTEGVLVPTNTNQLAKLRLYNTTRGNSALISNCNTGTNTITLTATVPANWASGDTITVASTTVSGGGFSWVDLEITTGPTGKAGLFVTLLLTSGAASDAAYCHPFDTFGGGKRTPRAITQVAGVQVAAFGLVPVVGNVFSLAWTAASSQVTIAEAGTIA
jgi:hypothetical protein